MKMLMPFLLIAGCARAFCAETPAPLFRGPLPALPPGHEVRMDLVELKPGSAAPPHRHDAHVYVYVIEGVIEMQVAGAELQRLEAGQVFTEGPGDVHVVMRNPSKTNTARFVSFIIKMVNATGFTPVRDITP
jgi:quercetin dioxygenase-like cupin family protein